jgi:hypothetical protein
MKIRGQGDRGQGFLTSIGIIHRIKISEEYKPMYSYMSNVGFAFKYYKLPAGGGDVPLVNDTLLDPLIPSVIYMSFEDGAATDTNDTAGDYSGTVYGGAINGNRAGKSNANSLSSDNTVLSTRYIEMPAYTVPVDDATQFAFRIYSESTGTGTTRIFEIGTQDQNIYLEQYSTDRTKFRYCDSGPIFYVPTDEWHHIYIVQYGNHGNTTSTVNVWLDTVNVVSSATIGCDPVEYFTAGWRIGKSISNVNNLTSIAGSIDEFYVVNGFTPNTNKALLHDTYV